MQLFLVGLKTLLKNSDLVVFYLHLELMLALKIFELVDFCSKFLGSFLPILS